jgi:hypothetical protein
MTVKLIKNYSVLEKSLTLLLTYVLQKSVLRQKGLIFSFAEIIVILLLWSDKFSSFVFANLSAKNADL